MSSYYKFYTYGLTLKNIKANYKYFIFPNGLDKLLEESKISYHQLKNDFSAHSFFLQAIIKYGFLYMIVFIINLFYLIKKAKDLDCILPFLISSTFLSLDTMLFLPILLMQIYLECNNKKNS